MCPEQSQYSLPDPSSPRYCSAFASLGEGRGRVAEAHTLALPDCGKKGAGLFEGELQAGPRLGGAHLKKLLVGLHVLLELTDAPDESPAAPGGYGLLAL